MRYYVICSYKNNMIDIYYMYVRVCICVKCKFVCGVYILGRTDVYKCVSIHNTLNDLQFFIHKK